MPHVGHRSRCETSSSHSRCTLSAINGGYYQPVTVAAIVDSEGNVRCPRLVSSTTAPTLIYAALESFKGWGFRPGPVANYELTINFQPPRQ